MAGDTQHAGFKRTYGHALNVVTDGVVLPEASMIEARGLTLQQIQAARLDVADIFTVQGTQWTDQDVADLALSDAERWIDIQAINQTTLGGGTSQGQISWADHYTYIRIVRTAGTAVTACLKYEALQ